MRDGTCPGQLPPPSLHIFGSPLSVNIARRTSLTPNLLFFSRSVPSSEAHITSESQRRRHVEMK